MGASLIVGAAVAAAWWATSEISDPPADPISTVAPVTYRVESGQIGHTLDFNGFAQWDAELEATGFAPGVVTEIWVDDGAVIDVGDAVLSVGLRPSIVLSGTVPAFRPLVTGTEGADVSQLQRFLADAGWYSGAIDGEFGNATRRAVEEWQEATGLIADGVVDLGDVIFIRDLPARVRVLVTVGERIESAE